MSSFYDKLRSYTEIVTQLAAIRDAHPDVCQLHPQIGLSSEKRPIPAITLGSPKATVHLLIIAGQQGDTRTGPMLALALAEHFAGSELTKRVRIDIIPLVNPDGYVYAQETDAKWTKNRAVVDSAIVGVNLNRNYGFKWGGDHGSSGDPAADDYRGSAAFSEPESSAVRDFVAANAEPQYFGMFELDGTPAADENLVLLPYGYTSGFSPDFLDQKYVADGMNREMFRVNSQLWRAGHTGQMTFPRTGAFIDWAHGQAGAKYAFQLVRGSAIQSEAIDITILIFTVGFDHICKHFLEELDAP